MQMHVPVLCEPVFVLKDLINGSWNLSIWAGLEMPFVVDSFIFLLLFWLVSELTCCIKSSLFVWESFGFDESYVVSGFKSLLAKCFWLAMSRVLIFYFIFMFLDFLQNDEDDNGVEECDDEEELGRRWRKGQLISWCWLTLW